MEDATNKSSHGSFYQFHEVLTMEEASQRNENVNVEEGRGNEEMPLTIDVEGGGDAVSPMEKETNKRTAEDYSHASTKHWKQHFMLLEEFHHSRAGKRGHRLGYCKHCFEAADSPTPEQRQTIQKLNYGKVPKPPAKMQIYSCICQGHLAKCKWVPREVRLAWQSREGGAAVAAAPAPIGLATNKTTRLLSRSSAASSGLASVASSTMDIRNHAVRRGLTAAEIPVFHRLMFNVVIDTRNPFTFPREPAVKELLEWLRPGLVEYLPSRHVVGGRLLREAAKEAAAADEFFKQRMRDRGYMESMTIDGWKAVDKIHIEGVLVMMGSQSYMEESKIAGADHHGIAEAQMIEKLYSAREDSL